MPAVQGHPAAAIADGLSNTFMAGEMFHRNAAPPYADGYTGGNWMGSTAHSNGRHGSGIARLAYYPINMPPNNLGTAFCFGSAHVGGGLFLFFDGSTRFIDDAVEFGGTNWQAPAGYGVYQKLGDCNDGQPISEY